MSDTALEPDAGPPENKGGRPPTHQLTKLRKSLRTLTTNRLDGRSAAAVAVRNFKQDIARDLGNDLTRAQEVILEQCARTFLILSALDDWIARQPSVVSKKRSLLPAVRERTQLVDSLTRGLITLGLNRVAKNANWLAELTKA